MTHHSRHCTSTGGAGPDAAAPATAGGGETVANSSGASANNAGRSSFVGVDYGTSGDLEAVHSATGCVQTWRPENVPVAHPSLFVWGRGGPGEERAVNIGARAHAAGPR